MLGLVVGLIWGSVWGLIWGPGGSLGGGLGQAGLVKLLGHWVGTGLGAWIGIQGLGVSGWGLAPPIDPRTPAPAVLTSPSRILGTQGDLLASIDSSEASPPESPPPATSVEDPREITSAEDPTVVGPTDGPETNPAADSPTPNPAPGPIEASPIEIDPIKASPVEDSTEINPWTQPDTTRADRSEGAEPEDLGAIDAFTTEFTTKFTTESTPQPDPAAPPTQTGTQNYTPPDPDDVDDVDDVDDTVDLDPESPDLVLPDPISPVPASPDLGDKPDRSAAPTAAWHLPTLTWPPATWNWSAWNPDPWNLGKRLHLGNLSDRGADRRGQPAAESPVSPSQPSDLSPSPSPAATPANPAAPQNPDSAANSSPPSWRDRVTFTDLLTRLSQETFADRSLPRVLGAHRPGAVDEGDITEGAETPGTDRSIASQTDAPRLQEVPPPDPIQRLQANYDRRLPQVQILEPAPDTVIQDETLTVKIAVQGYDLFRVPELDLGPHLAWVLDDRPAEALYDLSQPLKLTNLSPGSHTLRVFAVRPWGESYQNWGAFAQVTFHRYAPTPPWVPQPDRPLLTPHLPQGFYGAEPIVLDFVLTQAPLRILAPEDDPSQTWTLRCVLNGETFTLPAWEPIYLQGLQTGTNWLQMTLLDGTGEPWSNGGFNTVVQAFEYQPGGEDGRSRLMRGELSAEELALLRQP
ncbi:MAG: hypothetical protein ACO4CG_14055 [Prochlorothrix sp.]